MSTMQPPHSRESEQLLLGTLLQDGSTRTRLDLVTQDFYSPDHQNIWNAIQGVDAVDLFTVTEWLTRRGLADKAGGEDYLMELRDKAPPLTMPQNVAAYALAIKRLSKRRRFIEAAQAIAQAAYQETLDESEMLTMCERAYTRAASGITTARTSHISEVVSRVIERMEDAQANPAALGAVSTGFADVDKLMAGGAKPGELIIVAARPGMGKTSFLMSIVLNGVASRVNQKRGAIYTLEMSDESLVRRLMSGQTGISTDRMNTAQISTDEWGAILRAGEGLSNAPIYINDAPMSIASIQADARRLKAVYGLEYVMVDFLGLVDAPGEKEYQRTTNVALGAQALAKELRIPVFLACQLSRSVEHGNDKRPVMSDLRDSGRIEEAADVVVMLYRDEYYNEDTEFKNIAEILIRKNRNAPTGKAMLFFDKRLTAFKNLAKERIQLP
jgi:replicative DNA helicase